MNRWAKRTDKNQPEIVAALRAVDGVVVVDMSKVGGGFPDICVGYKNKTYLMEIKTKRGALNRLQKAFFLDWTGHAEVVRTPLDALAVIGALPLDDRFRRCQGDDYAR